MTKTVMNEDCHMNDETMYNEALQHAIATKKRYLTNALEQEALDLLHHIDPQDWSEADRQLAYAQDVRPYWKRFGRMPQQFWFELYGSRDQRMDPRFMPADLYYTDILPYMNDGMQHHGLMNKGYKYAVSGRVHPWFRNVEETIVSLMPIPGSAGSYHDML